MYVCNWSRPPGRGAVMPISNTQLRAIRTRLPMMALWMDRWELPVQRGREREGEQTPRLSPVDNFVRSRCPRASRRGSQRLSREISIEFHFARREKVELQLFANTQQPNANARLFAGFFSRRQCACTRMEGKSFDLLQSGNLITLLPPSSFFFHHHHHHHQHRNRSCTFFSSFFPARLCQSNLPQRHRQNGREAARSAGVLPPPV